MRAGKSDKTPRAPTVRSVPALARPPPLATVSLTFHGCRPVTWSLAPAYAYLALLTVTLAVIDIRTKTLPNVLTLTGYPVLLVLLAIPAAIDGRWDDYGRAVVGSAITLLAFTGMALLTPEGMGMGDAKLAGVLALPLAFESWLDLVFAMVGAFLLSAVVSIVLLALRRVDRRSLLPFGPYLMAATWLVIALR